MTIPQAFVQQNYRRSDEQDKRWTTLLVPRQKTGRYLMQREYGKRYDRFEWFMDIGPRNFGQTKRVGRADSASWPRAPDKPRIISKRGSAEFYDLLHGQLLSLTSLTSLTSLISAITCMTPAFTSTAHLVFTYPLLFAEVPHKGKLLLGERLARQEQYQKL